jgi:hypothetical protein
LAQRSGQESLRAARFLDHAEAKMLSLKIAPNGASFRAKLAKRPVFWPKIGGFPGFLFTDEYTDPVDQTVYIV